MYKRTLISVSALILSLASLVGCATIVASGPDMLPVNSEPEGARVSLSDQPIGRTPMTAAFARNCDGVLTFELDGYHDRTLDVDKVFNGWFLGNLVFGGPIGIITDLVMSNQGKYSIHPIFVELVPFSESDLAERDVAREIQPSSGVDVVITTKHGKIKINLFEEDAPMHAANFKKLAREGFYDGLTFHRVIKGFMAQGGDPDATGSGGPGYTIPAEIKRKHVRSSVAAARTGDAVNPQRKSSGSQFYICFTATPQLDNQYTVFGQVVDGMDVVDKIKRGNGPNGSIIPPGSGDKMLRVEVVER